MATNYSTVIAEEISDLEPRLWRLRQAIDVPDPKFKMGELDRELMEMRYETTLRLYRILRLQAGLFESPIEDQERMKEEFGSAERIIDATEEQPDYAEVAKAYKYELSSLDETNRFVDAKWLSITRPQDSMWKDYPEDLKKRLVEEADKCLRKTMGKKSYEKMKRESEEDGKMDYFAKYEKSISPFYSKSEVRKMVAAEKRYYRDLEKWDRNGGVR